MDGTRTVQAIIDSTGLGEFEICRILFDLLNRNLITHRGPRARREDARRTPAEAPCPRTPGYAWPAAALLLALVGRLGAARARPSR